MKFKILDIEQRSEEWHALRKTSIGASDIPVIMGISPYSTPYQLWARTLGLMREQEDNLAMARGRRMEPEALNWYNYTVEQEGVDDCVPIVAQSLTFPWAIASLDAFNFFKNRPVEIKCGSRVEFDNAKLGKIPDKYYPQIQWQMFVTQSYSCDFLAFNGEEGAIVTCEANPVYQQEILCKALEFREMIENSEPPPFSSKDELEREDDDWCILASELLKETEILKQAESRIKSIRSDLIQLAEQKPFHIQHGLGVRLNLVRRLGVIEYKNIPELKSVDLEKYRRPHTQSWTLTTK